MDIIIHISTGSSTNQRSCFDTIGLWLVHVQWFQMQIYLSVPDIMFNNYLQNGVNGNNSVNYLSASSVFPSCQ